MTNPEDPKTPGQPETPEVVEWVEQPLLQRAFISSDSRILKGVDADNPPYGAQPIWLLCLHTIEIPLPSDDSNDLAAQCMRTVNHPLMGPVQRFAVGTDAGLAMLEMAKALLRRDEKIAVLEGDMEALATRIEKAEGYIEALEEGAGRMMDRMQREDEGDGNPTA